MTNTYGEYGTLIVCGDYQGDLEAIAKVLNAFEFDQGDERDQRFVVHDGRIEPDRFRIDAVSAAFPLRWWYTSVSASGMTRSETSDCSEISNFTISEMSIRTCPGRNVKHFLIATSNFAEPPNLSRFFKQFVPEEV